jgi:hypothetical protein
MNHEKSRRVSESCAGLGVQFVGGNCFGTADGKAGSAGNVLQQNAGDLGEALARCHAGGSGEIGSTDLVTDVLEYGDATPNAREDGADF